MSDYTNCNCEQALALRKALVDAKLELQQALDNADIYVRATAIKETLAGVVGALEDDEVNQPEREDEREWDDPSMGGRDVLQEEWDAAHPDRRGES